MLKSLLLSWAWLKVSVVMLLCWTCIKVATLWQGFNKVGKYFRFGQNVLASLLSWPHLKYFPSQTGFVISPTFSSSLAMVGEPTFKFYHPCTILSLNSLIVLWQNYQVQVFDFI